MGSCTAKQSKGNQIKRRTASTIHEKSIRKGESSQKEIQIDLDHNSYYIDQYQDQEGGAVYGQETKQNLKCQSKNDEKSQSKLEQFSNKCYVSCFHDQQFPQDPITKIVLLEEACITLKHKMEQEKLKQQKKIQDNLKKFGQQTTQQSNNLLTSRQQSSTHFSVEQNNNSIQNIQQSNEIHCYNTIIKLADFIQEKSQKLWEDPEDVEINDALSSLFWASKMLQVDCLLEFKQAVSKYMTVYYDEKFGRDAHMKYSFNNFQQKSNQLITYS